MVLLLLSAETVTSATLADIAAALADGATSDEAVPLTYGALYAVGDVRAIGNTSFRLVDTITGAGLLTSNSDPNVVSIDPITGEDAPLGTDVGFASALRRYIHTGVLNGDFSVPPPELSSPISEDNPLPFWAVDTAGGVLSAYVSGSTSASGNVLHIDAAANAELRIGGVYQFVPIPRSQGQQYRVMLSAYAAVTGGLSSLALTIQFYAADATTTIGSLRYVGMNLSASEFKLDGGLVPTNASYVRVSLACGKATTAASMDVSEVRCAFIPAETTVTLKTLTGNSGAITSTETTVIDATIPENTFVVGATYRLRVYGTATNNTGSNKALTMNCRIGTSSLSGTVVATQGPNIATGNTNTGFTWEVWLVCRSVGATGTVFAAPIITGDSNGPFPSANSVDDATGTATIDTTVTNTLEVTASVAGGTASVNFRLGSIICENS